MKFAHLFFFFIFNKKTMKRMSLRNPIENGLQDKEFLSFEQLCFNFAKIKIIFFTFFYVHKKKALDSRKFSTSNFLWIYMI